MFKRSSSEIKGALIGTLLGDSYISNRGEFGCEQISENLIDYKAEILKSIHPDIKVYKHSRQRDANGFNNNPRKTYIIQTNSHVYFKKLREEIYKENKQVSMSVLNKLTPEGIALWFMDDGYCDYKKSNCTKTLRICTDSFDEFSISQIQTYFNNRLQIPTKIMMHKARQNYQPKPRVSIGGSKPMQDLVTLVYKYFLPEFYYKIDLHYKTATLKSKRCSKEYIKAVEYMLQRLSKEDIV